MMQQLSLKHRLNNGDSVYGIFNSIPDPLMIEVIAASGYDFVVIDTEHVAINDETLAHLIRAAEAAHIIPIVRVTAVIDRDIIKVLDMGARGIIVPHVKDRETVEHIVKLSRYYPQGLRSLNGGRMARFGRTPLLDAMEMANEHIMVIAMIEDVEGVMAIDDIAQVEGLDMVVEGAADLSQSLGIPWQTRDDQVTSHVQHIFEVVNAHGKHFCALPREDEDIAKWQAQGVQTFILGDDRGKIYRHLSASLATSKQKGDEG